MQARINFAALSSLFALLLLFLTELSGWEVGSVCFTVYTFLVFLEELGRTIAIRELMAFVACLQMIFAPTLELQIDEEALAISSNDYFSYALPATMLFCIGVTLPYFKTKPHSELLSKVSDYLVGKEHTVIILLVLGVIGSVLYNYSPISVQALVNRLAICLYASVMYAHFTKSKLRYITLFSALGLLLYTTVRDGMFGYLILWGALYIIIVLISKRENIKLRSKLSLVFIGLFFIVLAQSVKFEYRVKTWGDNKDNRKADPALMVTLMNQRLQNWSLLFSDEYMGAVYHRINQGLLVSESIAYVPSKEPFANGEVLAHFFYPFIPRIIWSGKPITGGEANMYRFTRFIPNGISSSNISTLGEGYVNFGHLGGILFQFFFGSLFNIVFLYIIRLAETKPSILLWLPCLFTGCLSFETDVLSTWGSLVIMAVFLVFFWQFTKKLNIQL